MDDAGGGRRGLRATVDPQLLEALGATWGVAPADDADLGGAANLNLLVADGSEQYVARVYRPHVDAARLDAIQQARDRLRRHGVPVAELIASTVVGDRFVELERFVPSDGRMNTWARLEQGLPVLALVHEALRDLDLASAPTFSNHLARDAELDAVRRGAERIRSWQPTDEERALADRAVGSAERVGALDVDLPTQAVHGDYWDNNVLFRGDEIVLVADLDFLDRRSRVDDLALTLYFATDLGDLLPRLAGLLSAYGVLTADERAALPVAIARQPLWSIGVWIAELDDERAAKAHAAGMVPVVDRSLGILAELDRWRRIS